MAALIETFPVGPLQCNCSIVVDEATGEAVVIDPGDEPERILAVLAAAKVRPVALLHTHAHLDHITGTRQVSEITTDLKGGDTEAILASIREKLFALPGSTPVICGHGPDTTIEEEKRLNPFASL